MQSVSIYRSKDPRPTPTDAECTTLLKTIDHLARHLTSTTAMFEEYRDQGRDALLDAWRSWKGEVPFPRFARLCIARRMRGAIREYRRWAFPCAPSALPDADTYTR
jgi:hypothetical protein